MDLSASHLGFQKRTDFKSVFFYFEAFLWYNLSQGGIDYENEIKQWK